MAIKVEIDSHSGFCGGVIRAIGQAEQYLSDHEYLYSLGSIVHNEAEQERLSDEGLRTISKEEMEDLPAGETILIRAHGEPPSVYRKTGSLGLKVIDCTCPVVLKLQQRIRKAYSFLHSDGRDGQIVIFGKPGHAEVLGLLGQVDGDALVIEDMSELLSALDSGQIKLSGPIEVFSQTTKSPSEYGRICSTLSEKMRESCGMSSDEFRDSGLLKVNQTICQQVASRHSELSAFALSHDVVVFVAGKSSSNGKVLCELCKSVNIRTYHVCGPESIRKEWFRSDDKVGVCGATSTPKWLLDEVAKKILQEN